MGNRLVKVQYKSGRVEVMRQTFADVLMRLGHVRLYVAPEPKKAAKKRGKK